MVTIEFTDSELRLAQQGASSAYRSGRGLIELGDLIGEAYLWMTSHYERVVEWREQGRHGHNKLRHACKQVALTAIAKERKRVTGTDKGDVFYYNSQMIRELLPSIFNVSDWVSGSTGMSAEPRGISRPAEGNSRLAMVSDVRSAFYSLPAPNREFLAEIFDEGSLDVINVIAAREEVSEKTIERRVDRLLDKMVERLGGEPPWAK